MNQMATRVLRSGNHMPVLGLGTWELTHNTADTIAKAIELGYPMIDTSGDYGTQPGIAEGLRRSGARRSDFYLVTKVEENEDAYEASKRNLDELRLDHVDLMLLHRPPQNGAGSDLWEGLIQAREDGLTKDIGVSNYPAQLIEQLIEETGEIPAVNQIEWSPFGHSDRMLGYADENDILIQAYSPVTRATRLDDPNLGRIAERYGKTPAQMLLRWDIQRDVVPLPKANKLEHLEENLDIFDFELAPDDVDALAALNERYSALGKLPYK